MYNIPHFKAKDSQEVIDFMKANPFVTICGIDKEGFPVATQVPVLLKIENETIVISGHLMRKQDHSIAFENNNKVLVIFSGPSAFVSAKWYTEKNMGSTWNYQSVHAKGLLEIKDEKHLYNLLEQLTLHFEKDTNAPTQVKHLTAAYMEHNMKAIYSFDIIVSNLQHVFKLSQNRDEVSKANIQAALNEGDAASKHIATAMKKL